MAQLVPPNVLSDRRQRALCQHLPELKPSATAQPANPQFVQIVSESLQLNDHARKERANKQTAREKADDPKTVCEKLGNCVVNKLLLLCNVPNDEDLPKVHHELAARSKGVSKRMLLKQVCDIVVAELKLNELPALSSQGLDLENFEFISAHQENLGGDLMLFSVVPPDAPSSKARKAPAEEQERTRLCDVSGEAINGAMLSSDTEKLHNSKGHIPTSWAEATLQIKLHPIILGAVLGTWHELVKECHARVDLCNDQGAPTDGDGPKVWGQAGTRPSGFALPSRSALLV